MKSCGPFVRRYLIILFICVLLAASAWFAWKVVVLTHQDNNLTLPLGPVKSAQVTQLAATSPYQTIALSGRASLDEISLYYFERARLMGHQSDECIPLLVSRQKMANIFYPYCSSKALSKDREPVVLTNNFSVPQSLAPIFNFWRRIYTLWNLDQYVLHLSNHPEVVLAIIDVNHLTGQFKAHERRKRAYQVVRKTRQQLKSLLLKMHRLRKKPELFTPAMKRIEIAMQHINDPRKYVKAAYNIRMQRGQRDAIMRGVVTSGRYIHRIKSIFQQEGLPSELAYLAFLESSFNLKAYSKVGASGIYQIMPATGRSYLRIDTYIDERNDPIKGARAAAQILRQNYNVTGSWALAIIAYNHGLNGIRRAIAQTRTSDIARLINEYEGPSFGFASKNFYPGFLAILATMKDMPIVFPDIHPEPALNFAEVVIQSPIRVRDFMRRYALDQKTLQFYNPDLRSEAFRYNLRLPKNYVVKIPADNIESQTRVVQDRNGSTIPDIIESSQWGEP